MRRTTWSLAVLAALVALSLAACDGNGSDNGDAAATTLTTAGPATPAGAGPATSAAGGTTAPGPATTAGPGGRGSGGGSGVTGSDDEARASVIIDDGIVPLRQVCRGVDGAVVAIAQGSERRIILVREQGLALRISTEGGTFAETDQVTITQVNGATRYSGTILVEGQPTAVSMDIIREESLSPC